MNKINNTTIVCPSQIEYGEEEVGNIYTTASGKTIVDTIRVKRVLSCSWNGMNARDTQTILSLLGNKVVSVTYFEPNEAEEVTKTFVVSEKKTPAYSLVNGKEIFQGMSATFLEQ